MIETPELTLPVAWSLGDGEVYAVELVPGTFNACEF
jgi:hypothetical protein